MKCDKNDSEYYPIVFFNVNHLLANEQYEPFKKL